MRARSLSVAALRTSTGRRAVFVLLFCAVAASACNSASTPDTTAVAAPASTSAAPPITTPPPTTTLPGTAAPPTTSSPEPDFLIEILELEAWAGSGQIAGFIRLRDTAHSGSPSSPDQPLCVGVDGYEDIRPGTAVVATAGAEATATELRGSSFDGHLGCGLWFGLEVDPDVEDFTLSIADHPSVEVVTGDLADAGWILELWTDALDVQAYCIDRVDDYDPGLCHVLEPAP